MISVVKIFYRVFGPPSCPPSLHPLQPITPPPRPPGLLIPPIVVKENQPNRSLPSPQPFRPLQRLPATQAPRLGAIAAMLLRRVRGFGGYGLEDRCGFGGCFRAGWVLGMGVLVPRELSSGWKGGFGRMVEEEGAAPERRKGGFYDGEEGAGSHERRNRR